MTRPARSQPSQSSPPLRSLLPLSLLLLPLLLSLLLTAAPARGVELPDWVVLKDVDAATQAFPDAETVQLLSSEDLEVGPDGSRTYRIREVFHVREGRADGHSLIVFISSNQRELRGMRAWRRDANGRVEVFDTPITTQLLGGELYAENKENSVSVLGIGPGAVVATELSFRDDSADLWTDSAPARSDLPVLRWEYRLKLPGDWRAEASWFDPITGGLTTAEPAKVRSGWRSWRCEKIPTFGEKEPYAPSEIATSPLFLVRYARRGDGASWTWKSIADWYRPYSESSLEGADRIREQSEALVGDAGTFDEKVSRIAAWVRSSIGYVQIYLGDGGYRPHPVEEVYANRFGDCKDMTHLTIAMLGAAGIRAYPVLTELGEHGRIHEAFPTTGFNHCIVAIERPTPDAGLLFFDPTAKTIPIGRLPYPLEGAPALIVGPSEDSTLSRLPSRDAQANGLRVSGTITVEPSLHAVARIRELRLGQSAYATRDQLLGMDPTERKRWVQDWIGKRFVGARIDSVAFPGLAAVGDTLTLFYVARIPEIGRRLGDLALIQPDFVTAWDARSFSKPERRRPLRFAYPYRNECRIELRFPEEWSATEVPKDAMVENRFASYRRRYEVGLGVARMERIEEARLTSLPASDYPLVQEWDRAAGEADRIRLVLKRP
jgi:hypothetical protein